MPSTSPHTSQALNLTFVLHFCFPLRFFHWESLLSPQYLSYVLSISTTSLRSSLFSSWNIAKVSDVSLAAGLTLQDLWSTNVVAVIVQTHNYDSCSHLLKTPHGLWYEAHILKLLKALTSGLNLSFITICCYFSSDTMNSCLFLTIFQLCVFINIFSVSNAQLWICLIFQMSPLPWSQASTDSQKQTKPFSLSGPSSALSVSHWGTAHILPSVIITLTAPSWQIHLGVSHRAYSAWGFVQRWSLYFGRVNAASKILL